MNALNSPAFAKDQKDLSGDRRGPMRAPGEGEVGVGSSGFRLPHRAIVDISPPDIADRRLTNWGAIQADTVKVTRRDAVEYGFRAERHLLIAHERAERHKGETLIEGLPKSTQREFNCKLSFVPAGHRFYGWETPRVLTRVTYFYIDFRNRLFEPGSGIACPTFSPRLFFFDQALWNTALKLKAEVGNSDPSSQIYVEALSIVLMHELARLERTTRAAIRPVRGGLPVRQQKRVAEFIEEHLAEEIALNTLAKLVDLSLYHFARAFRQSFGVPPHRYHMTRRMDHARSLLQRSALSVTQIGIQIGFRETSSFTRAYRKFAGVTPSAFRRSRED
jgi:AraC family transcriptional regulator